MRVRFVVFEKDVITRPVLFDEVCLKDKSLDLIVYNDKFKICDVPYQLAGLRVVITARMKI